MKKSILMLSFILVIVIVGFGTETFARQHMNWIQLGEKTRGNSYISTYFNGEVSSNVEWYGGSNHRWDGTSRSEWHGTNPYNADSVTHTDSIWLISVGTVSFGYPSGVSATVGNSSASFSYQDTNTYYVEVDYTYSAGAYLPVYTGQKSSGTFKFGSNFVVVDSEGNNTYEFKSNIWYT